MASKSLTDDGRLADTKLSALIEKARFSPEAESPDRSDRTRADAVFSEIADAIERGLTTLDPGSRDSAVLKRLRRELGSR